MGVGRCCCRSGGVASASIGGPHRRNTSSSIAYFFFCFCFVFFFFSLVSQRTCRSVFRRTADKTRRNLPPAMSTFLSSSTKLVSLDAANWNALEDVCTVWVLKKQMKNSVFQPIQRFSNAYGSLRKTGGVRTYHRYPSICCMTTFIPENGIPGKNSNRDWRIFE